MLIACPSCATSYMIDPASLGAAGQTVRCARCKATWFASPTKPAADLNAFVDGVIAEAEVETAGGAEAARPAVKPSPRPPPSVSADDFGAEPEAPIPQPQPAAAPAEAPRVEPAAAPEPVAASDAPSLVPPIEQHRCRRRQAPRSTTTTSRATPPAASACRRAARNRGRSPRWTAIVLVLFSINVALIGARDEVVRCR